jgi:hypothetical protein
MADYAAKIINNMPDPVKARSNHEMKTYPFTNAWYKRNGLINNKIKENTIISNLLVLRQASEKKISFDFIM